MAPDGGDSQRERTPRPWRTARHVGLCVAGALAAMDCADVLARVRFASAGDAGLLGVAAVSTLLVTGAAVGGVAVAWTAVATRFVAIGAWRGPGRWFEASARRVAARRCSGSGCFVDWLRSGWLPLTVIERCLAVGTALVTIGGYFAGRSVPARRFAAHAVSARRRIALMPSQRPAASGSPSPTVYSSYSRRSFTTSSRSRRRSQLPSPCSGRCARFARASPSRGEIALVLGGSLAVLVALEVHDARPPAATKPLFYGKLVLALRSATDFNRDGSSGLFGGRDCLAVRSARCSLACRRAEQRARRELLRRVTRSARHLLSAFSLSDTRQAWIQRRLDQHRRASRGPRERLRILEENDAQHRPARARGDPFRARVRSVNEHAGTVFPPCSPADIRIRCRAITTILERSSPGAGTRTLSALKLRCSAIGYAAQAMRPEGFSPFQAVPSARFRRPLRALRAYGRASVRLGSASSRKRRSPSCSGSTSRILTSRTKSTRSFAFGPGAVDRYDAEIAFPIRSSAVGSRASSDESSRAHDVDHRRSREASASIESASTDARVTSNRSTCHWCYGCPGCRHGSCVLPWNSWGWRRRCSSFWASRLVLRASMERACCVASPIRRSLAARGAYCEYFRDGVTLQALRAGDWKLVSDLEADSVELFASDRDPSRARQRRAS